MAVITAISFWIMAFLAGFFVFATIVDYIVYRGGTGYFIWLIIFSVYNVNTIIMLAKKNPWGLLTFASAFFIYRAGTFVHFYWVMWKNR